MDSRGELAKELRARVALLFPVLRLLQDRPPYGHAAASALEAMRQIADGGYANLADPARRHLRELERHLATKIDHPLLRDDTPNDDLVLLLSLRAVIAATEPYTRITTVRELISAVEAQASPA